MGDFNINLITCGSNRSAQDFLDTFLSSSLLPVITKPTRITDNYPTLIDNIFTNFHSSLLTGIVISDISDHYPIFANLSIELISRKQIHQSPKFKFTDENIGTLKEKLNADDWSAVYISQDINVSYDTFISILTTSIDNTIPRTKQKRFHRKRIPKSPWITKSVLRSFNRKNNVYYKYIKSKPNPDLKHTNEIY